MKVKTGFFFVEEPDTSRRKIVGQRRMKKQLLGFEFETPNDESRSGLVFSWGDVNDDPVQRLRSRRMAVFAHTVLT